MTNEKRAEELIKKYGFSFHSISKNEIRNLIEQEIQNFQEGSSEYIRVLCGYLFCIGDITDVPLLEKAKYSINMDVGCMIDKEWIDSLKNSGIESEFVNSRNYIIENFISRLLSSKLFLFWLLNFSNHLIPYEFTSFNLMS